MPAKNTAEWFAQIEASLPEGYTIVPKEPTKEMIEAANTAIENATDTIWDSMSDEMYGGLASSAPYDIWKAMLAATHQQHGDGGQNG